MPDIPRAKVTESADGEISCSIEETNRIRAALGLRPLDVPSSTSIRTTSSTITFSSSRSEPATTETSSSSLSHASSIPRANVTESIDGEISCSIEETNRIRAALGLRPLDVSSSHNSSNSAQSTIKKEIFVYLNAQREEENRANELVAKSELARKEREAAAASRAKSLGESLTVTKQMSTAEWVALSRKKENQQEHSNGNSKVAASNAHRISALAEEADEDGFSIINIPKPSSGNSNISQTTNNNQLIGMKIHHGNEAFTEGETMILTFADTGVLDEEGQNIANDDDLLINVDLAAKERTQEMVDRKRKISQRNYPDLDDDTKPSSILSQYDDEENEKKRRKRAALIIQENGQVESVHDNTRTNTSANNERFQGQTKINLAGPNTAAQGRIADQLSNIASDYVTKAELLAIAKPKGKKKLRTRNDDNESGANFSNPSSTSVSSSSQQIMQELQQQQPQTTVSNEVSSNDRGSRASRRADGVSRQLDEAIANTNAGMKAFEAAVAKETQKTAAKLGHAAGFPVTDKSWTTIDATTITGANYSNKSIPPPLINGTGTLSSSTGSSVSNVSRQRIYSRLRNDIDNTEDQDDEIQAALLRARRLAKPEEISLVSGTSNVPSTGNIHDPALRLNALLNSYQQNPPIKEEENSKSTGIVYSAVTEFSGRLQAEVLETENNDHITSVGLRSDSVPDVVEANLLRESTSAPHRGGIAASTVSSNTKRHGWSEDMNNNDGDENYDDDMEIENTDHDNTTDNDEHDDDNETTNHQDSFTANEEETNSQLHKGVASALHILRRMGATQQEEEYFGRAKDKRPDWDKTRDTSSNTNTKGRLKEIDLDYRDDEGHKLTPKQAFRELSYRFHGQAPSRHVKDKRLRRLEKERQTQQANNGSNSGGSGNQTNSSTTTGTSNSTINILQRAQEMQGQAFITLEKR